MLFHSFSFFALFAVTGVVYWWLKDRDQRLWWVLLASCVFYMSWNPWLIALIFLSTSVDYVVARRLEGARTPRIRKGLLALSVAVNLGILGTFKYADFALASTSAAAGMLGWKVAAPVYGLVLPLGISFYTFEAISYVVDVYRGKIAAVRRPLDYLVYIMFFPHLIAGPIVRPQYFLPQLRQAKRLDWDRLQVGAQLFLMGLFKKAVIADNLAAIVDPVFADPGAYGTGAAWLAVLGYAAQIYCDFSGYSDMAVGVAHWLGFKLPMNFNMPYAAGDIGEFWARWHISLSTWLRDYLYIPLGGNRQGTFQTYRNLLLTMLLGGLWHGAAWTFVAWGLYHGLLLVAHRMWATVRPDVGGAMRPLSVLLTFLSVCVGWVLFRAQSFTDAGRLLARMAWPTAGKELAGREANVVLALLAVVLAAHAIGTMVDLRRWERWVPAPMMGAALAGALLLAQLLMPETVKAFIYFQF